MPNLEKAGTEVLGVSVDSVPANHVFAQQIKVAFPLLSDFKRTVSQEYGVLNPEQEFANRTTFVIDKQGIIRRIDKDAEALDPSSAVQECSLIEHRKQEKKK